MKLITVLLLSILLAKTADAYQNQPEYLPGTIIIKFEPEQILAQKAQDQNVHPRTMVQDFLKEYGITRFQKVFDEGANNAVRRTLSKRNIRTDTDAVVDDLSRTFFVDYTSPVDPKMLSAKIAGISGVVYAEPRYIYHLLDEPNDPLFGSQGQDFFDYQNFVEAWAVTKSSIDVVIAIVDTGVFYEHPDLISKLWRNPESGRAREVSPALFEDVVNDSIGWNFWEGGNVFAGEEPIQNNKPIARWSNHGTHVAGIAAAQSNNEIGITGTGFNASFMPVKIGSTRQFPEDIPFGVEGILYAAINEADIINVSFGGENHSKFGEDVINTATELGSLIVASAGNSGNDTPFFPASYDNVLSVGSVDTPTTIEQVNISSFSSIGFNIDVFATGNGILSTGFEYDVNEDTWTVDPDSVGYIFGSGTSMSAPVVSGLAALVKHQHPDWAPRRIAYQIRNTANPIMNESINDFRLGHGVIDAFSAVTTSMPGLEITEIKFLNEDGNNLNIGEEGFAEVTVVNHGEVVDPSVSITSLTDNISVSAGKNVGSIETDQTITIELSLAIEEDYNLDENPILALEFADQSVNYDDFSIQEYENLLYENVETGALTMSFPNDGTIGFRNAIEQNGGVGFITPDEENQLFEGGLMIHAVLDDTTHVINQVRFQNSIVRDFSPVQNITRHDPELSDIEFSAIFNSSNHSNISDLNIKMETFAFEHEDLNQAVFVRYTITNSSTNNYNDVHVGLFNDWDIGEVVTNYVAYNETDSLQYVYDGQQDEYPFVAVAHMGAISSAFAIDNASELTLELAQTFEDSLRFGVYYDFTDMHLDGFTREEKQLALKSGLEQTTMDNADISTVTGSGPFNLEEDGVISVGFIYAYGSDLDDLRNQVHNARELDLFTASMPGTYRNGETLAVPEITKLYQNYPNPFQNSTTIQYDLAEQAHVELAIYNVLGQRVSTLIDTNVNEGRQRVAFDTRGLASGVYLAVLRTDDNVHSIKMSLIK